MITLSSEIDYSAQFVDPYSGYESNYLGFQDSHS